MRSAECELGPGCYQSNRFCGPIQGDMKTNSKVQRLKAEVRPGAPVLQRGERPEAESRGQKSEVRGQKPEDGRPRTEDRRPAAVGYLARFLCAGLTLALLASGCVGPRPLKGGRAVTIRKPAGGIEQTLVQGENPSQPSKQDQETVKVRSYTLPAGSRIEQSSPSASHDPQNGLLSPSKEERVPKAGEGARQPSTINSPL